MRACGIGILDILYKFYNSKLKGKFSIKHIKILDSYFLCKKKIDWLTIFLKNYPNLKTVQPWYFQPRPKILKLKVLFLVKYYDANLKQTKNSFVN